MNKVSFFIATGFFSGLSPKAPGTAGSLVAVLLYFPLLRFPWMHQIAFILLLLAIAVWSAQKMENQTGIHDDSRIVIDEFVGMWITLFAITPSWIWIGVAFGLFRLMDIWKPYPANLIDRTWKGGQGVVFDDAVAGIYAYAILRGLERLVLMT